MSNVYKFCGCRCCRAGRRACRGYTQKTLRSFRRQAKQALKHGVEPPTKISVCYSS